MTAIDLLEPERLGLQVLFYAHILRGPLVYDLRPSAQRGFCVQRSRPHVYIFSYISSSFTELGGRFEDLFETPAVGGFSETALHRVKF